MKDEGGADPYDLDFVIPRGEVFAEALSEYGLFAEPMAGLEPAEGVLVYELSSELFTDYAYKQRMMVVPEGESIEVGGDEQLSYPEGTVLVKTFYYPADMREEAGERRILETRLLVKRDGVWNVATYLWNEEQTDATLSLEGSTTSVSWIDASGEARSTEYAVPHEGECVTCHQLDGASVFIGPTLRNLNRSVLREGVALNQLDYLSGAGVLPAVDATATSAIPDYRDDGLSLSERARAYLDANCAHCHNPDGWDEASERPFDFRFDMPLEDTGLLSEIHEVSRALERGEMPYLGTTMEHSEGVELVKSYLNSL